MTVRAPTRCTSVRSLDSAWIAVTVGLGFAIAGAAYFLQNASGTPFTRQVLAFILFVGLPLVAVAAGLYARYEHDEFEWVVAGWCVGGAASLVFLSLWIQSDAVMAGRYSTVVESLIVTGNLGTAFGAFIGLSRAQARRNARLAERERTQREGMALVTHLLQHHVRNGMTIVRGYADELKEAGNKQQVNVIEAQTERIGELVENVDTLVRALSDETVERPVEVDTVAADAVESARERYPDADITLEAEPATVQADALLGAVFENLLSNAVEHHDGDEPSIQVTVTDGDPVEIRVVDDGPGVPDAVCEALSDPEADNIGSVGGELGLYLVWTLVTGYGGTVDLERRDSRGTVAIVELPST